MRVIPPLMCSLSLVIADLEFEEVVRSRDTCYANFYLFGSKRYKSVAIWLPDKPIKQSFAHVER